MDEHILYLKATRKREGLLDCILATLLYLSDGDAATQQRFVHDITKLGSYIHTHTYIRPAYSTSK